MGTYSANNGKILLHVPWDTGPHYSHKRLQEFIGEDGIKRNLTSSNINIAKKPFPLTSMDKKPTPAPGSKAPKSPSHKTDMAHAKADELPAAVSLKSLLPEEPDYRWRQKKEQADKHQAWLKKKQEREIPSMERPFPASYIKNLKLPQIKPQKKPLARIEPKRAPFLLKPEKPKVIEAPKPPAHKGPGLKEKMKDLVNSQSMEGLAKVAVMLIVSLPILAILLVGGGLAVLFLAPQYVVPTIEMVPAPANYTSNQTDLAPAINPTLPTATGKDSTVRPIVVTYPSNPAPTTPPVVYNPPSPPKPNETITPPAPSHDLTGIPQNLLFQASYDCYWELRDNKFGKELNVEYACNSQDTGLWIEACACCKTMGICQ